MTSSASRLGDTDLYGLLDLSIEATTNDIRKAYRKKALQCHPDKNPDNPKAAELFHQLANALEVLLDESARAAYDRLIKAKEAAKLRHRELDSKRKKFKEDLEARERAHSSGVSQKKTDEEKLKAEIERLRKEGAKLVQDEIQLLKEQVLNDIAKEASKTEDGSAYRIKVEWKVEKDIDNNGGYNQENLERIFMKYGDIAALFVPPSKGQAMVEFQKKEAAELALQIELGLMTNPLKLKWADKKKRKAPPQNGPSKQSVDDTVINDRDYESLVLRKMRQAEERRKLIEQMEKEDE